MAKEERTGLSAFDGVLMVGGLIIALFVAFKVLGFIGSLIWILIKLAVVVGLVVLVARFLFRRKS